MSVQSAADWAVTRLRVYSFDLSTAVLAGFVLSALAPVVNYHYPGLELNSRTLFFVGLFLVTAILTWHRGRWSQLDAELAELDKRKKSKALKPNEYDMLRQRAIARFGQGRYGGPPPGPGTKSDPSSPVTPTE